MIPSIVNMQDAFSLKGKNALVTGGNRGLGLAIASAFAQQGANVAIFCRDAKKAAEAIEELKPFGGKYQSFSCDVTDLPNVRKVVQRGRHLRQRAPGYGRGAQRLVPRAEHRPERHRPHDL